MAITIHLYYTGKNGNAAKFAEEMRQSGLVEAIRAEPGNLQYAYFTPLEEPETLLLVDRWQSQQALDAHHATPMMGQIAALREKYDLHMRVERYTDAAPAEGDEGFIRK